MGVIPLEVGRGEGGPDGGRGEEGTDEGGGEEGADGCGGEEGTDEGGGGLKVDEPEGRGAPVGDPDGADPGYDPEGYHHEEGSGIGVRGAGNDDGGAEVKWCGAGEEKLGIEGRLEVYDVLGALGPSSSPVHQGSNFQDVT